jgi:hypothetical protein
MQASQTAYTVATVKTQPNLFEYLAQPVNPPAGGQLTRLTEADGEDYDQDRLLSALNELDPTTATWKDGESYDEANLDSLGLPSGLHDLTRKTAVDNETYDDDAGIDSLASPWSAFADQTLLTRTEPETYDDDPGVTPLAIPSAADDSRFTKVDGETYDDDPGVSGLAFPQL